jgi:hypothetical protein
MDKQEPELYRVGRSYGMRCKAIPSPPGKKFKGKHLHELEESAARRYWLTLAATAVLSLAVGLLAGRFLLP